MLDVSVRSGILRVMLDLRASRGVSILFITHDLSLAWLIADRIAVMYLGRIVEVGPAEEVVHRPAHPYTRALLSVLPSPDPTRRRERIILSGETPDASQVPGGCRFHPRCPVAIAACATTDPPMRAVGAAHEVACILVGAQGPAGTGSAGP
jgi:oligopeptide/dipeptide ABC transporter ATP-binding protein